MDGQAHLRVMPARIFGIAAAIVLAASAATVSRWRLVPVQQDQQAPRLSAGKILVARRSLEDPNFAETVVVLVQYDEEGTVGLILNRQTKVPVSKLSRDLEGAKGRTEPLFLGGPVAKTGVMGLIRTDAKLDEAKHVFGDVYAVTSKAAVEKAIASNSGAKTLRLYLGYAGWDAEQLEFELGLDAWDVLPANADIVFDPHPETLWSRLVEQEGLRVASLRQRSAGALAMNAPAEN